MSWLSDAWNSITGTSLTADIGAVGSAFTGGLVGDDTITGALNTFSGDDWFTEGGGGGGDSFGNQPVMGGMGMVAAGGAVAAAGAGLVSLATKLARSFGGFGSSSFIINGVKGNMAQLWPLVRKYGPVSVAGALGIGAATLADLLMRAPANARKRRRGISAADIRRTKRVIRFNRSLSRQLGLGGSRGGRHRHVGHGLVH